MENEHIFILDALEGLDSKNYISRTKDKVVVKNKIRQIVRELDWIEIIEKKIPFIDELVRNPRSYIVHEEELLPTEKTKKISKDTVKHLAQNTSLIQEVEKDGSVKPLKLLNVFKESTFDLYENRFVYSLIFNIKSFINEQLAKIEEERESKYNKTLKYNSTTNYNNELVRVHLEINNQYKKSKTELLKEEEVNNRIRKLNEIFSEFLTTKFALEMYGSMPVRSPLRKTNAILKDANLNELVELWEFIESYDRKKAVSVVELEKEEKTYNIESKLRPLMYVGLDALNNISKKDNTKSESKTSLPYIKRIIENYVSEYDTTEKEFKTMINNEFRRAREKKQEYYAKIRDVYSSVLSNHNKNKQIAIKFLK